MIYALAVIVAGLFAFIYTDGDLPKRPQDARKQEAQYIRDVKKQDAKEEYKRAKQDKYPSGFMTMEEYNKLSAPKDKMNEKIEVPKVEKPADMKYVPQPTYKIVRYNNPPGSPEISLKTRYHERRQQNAQGVVSPDFSIMVYPSVYYYPETGGAACDVFVIKLQEDQTNLNKILTANTQHRLPDPILSTDKEIANLRSFRTITPIDFSADGTKLLAKEKIGSTLDGIWQTNALVYDFTNNVSYNLVEVRDAIIYYWKEYKGLNLDEVRWDIYPLGFDMNNPDRIMINAYAYTGKDPVSLGIWSVDYKGEQSRLVTFKYSDIQVSMNGFKIAQDGVVPVVLVEQEEELQKKADKQAKKDKKKKDKAADKELEKKYKERLKEIDAEYKADLKEFERQERLKGSTEFNDIPNKYADKRMKELERQIPRDEQKLQKQTEAIEKLDAEIEQLKQEIEQAGSEAI